MQIPAKGLAREALFAALEAYRERDLRWRSGKVLGYTYHPGDEAEEIIKQAYLSYLTENALDPTSYPSLMRMERDIVRMVINLLRGGPEVVGNFTSGGTESILLAVKTARDMARTERPHITHPEMIVPQTAHAAFHKAAAYFDVKAVISGFDPVTFEADPADMANRINENTILLVGSAPSYGHGVIDPIHAIGELALRHKLLFHVDACVGGIYLSFLRKSGHGLPAFDWTVPGVTSISTDLHKFGYAAKNASVIMYRDKNIRRHQLFACSRTTTYALINPTLLSTKSGGPLAGSWAILHHLGEAGYERIGLSVHQATQKMIAAVNAAPGLRVLGRPQMCMFAIASDTLNVFQLTEAIARRGWYLQPQFSAGASPANLHATVTVSNVPCADQFEADLRAAVEEVAAGEHIDRAAIKAQVDSMLEMFPNDAVQRIAEMANFSGGGLPESMALLNTVLDCLPNSIREPLLIEFMNDLYV